jgi:hypothetical protein
MPHIVTLANDRLRQRAIDLITAKRPDGSYVLRPNSRVELKGPKRSTNQNAALWAMLSDLADQLTWGGQRLSAEDFKLVMLDAIRRERKDEMRIVPSYDRTGFVNVSPTSSSDLSHEDMSDLLTIIRAFGDQHQVVWSEPKPKDMPPAPPVEAYEDAR